MTRKRPPWSWGLPLAVFLTAGFGGLLGVSVSVWNLSLTGSVLIVIAFAQSIIILAGLFMFRHRLLSVKKSGEE